MKKMLKIVGIIILFGVIIFAIFSVVYNEYIKYLIKQEEKRIDSYKEYEFVLDDEYKVKIYYNSGLEVADASFTTSYNINLKNNTIEIYSTSINHMPVWYNKFVLWGENKAELEQLRMQTYNIRKIKLEESNKKQLEDLIRAVLNRNKTVEEYNKEHKDTISPIPYQAANPSTYLVSTMNKTKVVMDNPEQIALFFKIIGKKHSVAEKAINGY